MLGHAVTRRALIPSAVAVGVLVAALPAPAGAAVQTIPASPSSGGPRTTFTVIVGPALVRKLGRRDLNLWIEPPRGSARACDPDELPVARFSGSGRRRTARFVIRPTLLRNRTTWCPGTYRLRVYAEEIVDDDETTGQGGTFDEDLARSQFVVRRGG